MSKSYGKVSKRYARALFELCEPSQMELRRNALHALVQELSSNRELAEVLDNPAIPPAQREAVMRDLSALYSPADTIMANFLATVVQHKRLHALPSILDVFSKLIAQFMRTLSLEVTSALSLSEEEKQQLLTEIKAKVPGSLAALVSISWKEDPELIGGMVVKAGDNVLDGSLAGSLNRVARALQ